MTLSCSARQYFSTLSHRRHDFRGAGAGGVFENEMCDLILSEIFLILRRIDRDVVANLEWSSCKVPVIRVKF